VRPAVLAGEAGEERRGGDGAAGPAVDIGEVGEVRAQLLLVFLPQRQPSDAVEGVPARGADLVGELLVVGEQPVATCPSAMTQAPVRVAMSITTSGS
jgi:hypothetical protein